MSTGEPGSLTVCPGGEASRDCTGLLQCASHTDEDGMQGERRAK